MTSSRESQTCFEDAIASLLKELVPTDDTQNMNLADTDRHIAACQRILEVTAKKLRSYRCQHNTLVSIHNVPTEIFHQILREHANARDSRHYYSNLLPLRMVSTQWKSAIDLSPSLWAPIALVDQPTLRPLPNRNLLKLILKLSQTAPLDLTVSVCDLRRFRASVREVSRHAWRWQSLDAELGDADDFRWVLSFPTPNLQRLCLRSPHAVALEEPLFTGVPPTVKELELERVRLPRWDAPYLHSLSSFTLSHMMGTTFELKTFLTFLRCSPVLANLHLTDVYLQPSDASHEALLAPALRTIIFEDVSPNLLIWFMEHGVVPGARTIHLKPGKENLRLLLTLARATGPWINQLPPDLKSAGIKCYVKEHAVVFTLGNLVKVGFASQGSLTWESELEEICQLIGSKIQNLPISLDIRHWSPSALLRLWRTLEGCFADVTRLTIRERYPVSGQHVDPTFVKILGERAILNGEFRWRYSRVTSLVLMLGESVEESIDDVQRLVKYRWQENHSAVEKAAQLKELTLAGLNVPDDGLAKLQASLLGCVVTVDRTHIRTRYHL